MLIDDVWQTIEATLGNLTPAKARELAKSIAEPGAAKEQVAKTAADLMEWSQHNRERIRSIVSARDRGSGCAPRPGLAGRARRPEEACARARTSRGDDRLGTDRADGPGQEDRRQEVHGQEDDRSQARRLEGVCDVDAPGRGRLADRMTRRRLDAELVRRGLAASRAEAQEAVRAGLVTVAGSPATKAATMVADDAPVELAGPARRFVSRGGEKLDAALDRFAVDPAGLDVSRRRRLDRGIHRSPAARRGGPRDRRSTWGTGSSRGRSAPMSA